MERKNQRSGKEIIKEFRKKVAVYIDKEPFYPSSEFHEISKDGILKYFPRSIKLNGNNDQLLYLQHNKRDLQVVVCICSKFLRVKRPHGHLAKFAKDNDFHFLKFTRRIPELDEFFRYIPGWVRTKQERESFSSLFKVLYRSDRSREAFKFKKTFALSPPNDFSASDDPESEGNDTIETETESESNNKEDIQNEIIKDPLSMLALCAEQKFSHLHTEGEKHSHLIIGNLLN